MLVNFDKYKTLANEENAITNSSFKILWWFLDSEKYVNNLKLHFSDSMI